MPIAILPPDMDFERGSAVLLKPIIIVAYHDRSNELVSFLPGQALDDIFSDIHLSEHRDLTFGRLLGTEFAFVNLGLRCHFSITQNIK